MSGETYQHLFERIRQIDPTLDLSDAVVNTDGLVNVAIICNGQVYRFARNEQAVHDLVQEAAILDLVRQHVTIPVPAFEIKDRDFVTYPFLAGDPLFRNTILRLPSDRQEHLAQQLARFLREMHAIPVTRLHDKHIHRSGGRQTQAEWLALYDDVRRELFPLMYRSTRSWVDAHFEPLVQHPDWLAFQPALIHDDLAQYHILYDAENRSISGIIDFGTAGLGDPARDVAILVNVYGESFVQRMARFDDRLPSLIDRARFYAGTFELQWVLGGVRSGDNGWFTAHLDRARDVQPYGQPLLR
jgi:aminoglycoside 2''-phosphotransferase